MLKSRSISPLGVIETEEIDLGIGQFAAAAGLVLVVPVELLVVRLLLVVALGGAVVAVVWWLPIEKLANELASESALELMLVTRL